MESELYLPKIKKKIKWTIFHGEMYICVCQSLESWLCKVYLSAMHHISTIEYVSTIVVPLLKNRIEGFKFVRIGLRFQLGCWFPL